MRKIYFSILSLFFLSSIACGQKQIGSGSLSGGCIGCITPVTLQSITLNPSGTPSIASGTTVNFTAIGNYSDTSTQDVTATATWASSNTTVASLINGNTGNAPQQFNASTAGSTNITAQVGAVVSAPTNLTVVTLTISPTNLPSVTTGNAYNQTINVSGGTSPYSWSCTVGCTGSNPWVITGSSLQLNASTTASTTITGTAGTVGNYSFTVKVCDHNSICITQAYTISITSASTCTPGPPNYSCSNFTTGNYNGYPAPITPLFAGTLGVNQTNTDDTLNPNYDCYTRLTDAASFGNLSIGNLTHSGGDNDHNWSWNEDYVGVTFLGGSDVIYRLTTLASTANCPNGAVQVANPVSVIHPSVCKTGTSCTEPNLGACGTGCATKPANSSWGFIMGDPIHDNRLYTLNSYSEVWQNDINNDHSITVTKLFDFAAAGACPGIGNLGAPKSGTMINISWLGTRVNTTFSYTGGQGTGTWIASWDQTLGCSTMNLVTGDWWTWCNTGSCSGNAKSGTETQCNNANATNNNSGTHNSQTTWDGQFMMNTISAAWPNSTGTNSKCVNPTGNGAFYFVWQSGTGNVQIASFGTPDYAAGHNSEGFSHHLAQNYPQPNIRQDSNMSIWSIFYSFDNTPRGNDLHGTWPHPNGDDTFPWWLQITANSTNYAPVSDTSPAYLVNEIYALGPLATYPPGATPVRFGHTFMQYTATPGGYFGCKSAIGTGSPKGNYAVFASTMMGNLGTDGTTSLISSPPSPSLSQAVSGALGATTYFVKTTIVNANGETTPSVESSKAVSVNNVLVVNSPPTTPGSATGYNVYVSTTTGTETKQNGSPIAFGTSWQEPNTGLVVGANPPTTNTAQYSNNRCDAFIMTLQ